MQPRNDRKFQTVYWSFMEFGNTALSHEEAWFCMMTEYSHVINEVQAGMSQVFAQIIRMFFNRAGIHFGNSGVSLPGMDGNNIRVFAKLKAFIMDGCAHKSLWHHRGSAASRFCLLCSNLFTASSRFVDEDGSQMLKCNVIKKHDLKGCTNQQVRRWSRYVASQASTMGPTPFKLLQQAVGKFTTHIPYCLKEILMTL